jgi:hypothetical protein
MSCPAERAAAGLVAVTLVHRKVITPITITNTTAAMATRVREFSLSMKRRIGEARSEERSLRLRNPTGLEPSQRVMSITFELAPIRIAFAKGQEFRGGGRDLADTAAQQRKIAIRRNCTTDQKTTAWAWCSRVPALRKTQWWGHLRSNCLD